MCRFSEGKAKALRRLFLLKILQNPGFFTDNLLPETFDTTVLRWRGERIVLGFIVPVEPDNAGFTPDMILMGPGLTDEGKIPETVEVEKGME